MFSGIDKTMSANGSIRCKMLVKLALEDKFAVMADELTVIPVTDTLRRAGLSTGSLDSNEEEVSIILIFVTQCSE